MTFAIDDMKIKDKEEKTENRALRHACEYGGGR